MPRFAEIFKRFDPNQPRADDGKWTFSHRARNVGGGNYGIETTARGPGGQKHRGPNLLHSGLFTRQQAETIVSRLNAGEKRKNPKKDFLAGLARLMKYDPNQPRADDGKWTSGGAGSGGDGEVAKPKKILNAKDTSNPYGVKRESAGGAGKTLYDATKSDQSSDDILKEKLTPEEYAEFNERKNAAMAIFDDPKQQTHIIHTKDGDGKTYTKERRAMHAAILREFFTPENIEKFRPADGEAPTITLLGGRGGSGKGSLKGRVYDPAKTMVLDPDKMKELIGKHSKDMFGESDYNGWDATRTHEESSHIMDRALRIATKLGINFVMDVTMKSGPVNRSKKIPDVEKTLYRAQGRGYRSEAHYQHLPAHEAGSRSVERWKRGKDYEGRGRLVPPDIILGNTRNEENFDVLSGKVDKWSLHHNMGKEPVLVKSFDGKRVVDNTAREIRKLKAKKGDPFPGRSLVFGLQGRPL